MMIPFRKLQKRPVCKLTVTGSSSPVVLLLHFDNRFRAISRDFEDGIDQAFTHLANKLIRDLREDNLIRFIKTNIT